MGRRLLGLQPAVADRLARLDALAVHQRRNGSGVTATGEVDVSYFNANPGTQQNTVGSAVSLQVNSLSALAGHSR
jgi:hypothetical protein